MVSQMEEVVRRNNLRFINVFCFSRGFLFCYLDFMIQVLIKYF